jgi:hypothetical protein
MITCSRSPPEARSGREAGMVHESMPCSPALEPSRPTTSPQAQPAWTRITDRCVFSEGSSYRGSVVVTQQHRKNPRIVQ